MKRGISYCWPMLSRELQVIPFRVIKPPSTPLKGKNFMLKKKKKGCKQWLRFDIHISRLHHISNEKHRQILCQIVSCNEKLNFMLPNKNCTYQNKTVTKAVAEKPGPIKKCSPQIANGGTVRLSKGTLQQPIFLTWKSKECSLLNNAKTLIQIFKIPYTLAERVNYRKFSKCIQSRTNCQMQWCSLPKQ